MFKKEDFKNGMVVQLDTGSRRLFWDERFIDQNGYIPLSDYNDSLLNTDRIPKDENIVKIYTVNNVGYFNDFFVDENLTEIWNRD